MGGYQKIEFLVALLCIGKLWYGFGFLKDSASMEVREGEGE